MLTFPFGITGKRSTAALSNPRLGHVSGQRLAAGVTDAANTASPEQQLGTLSGAAQDALQHARALVLDLEAAGATLAGVQYEADIAGRWLPPPPSFPAILLVTMAESGSVSHIEGRCGSGWVSAIGCSDLSP